MPGRLASGFRRSIYNLSPTLNSEYFWCNFQEIYKVNMISFFMLFKFSSKKKGDIMFIFKNSQKARELFNDWEGDLCVRVNVCNVDVIRSHAVHVTPVHQYLTGQRRTNDPLPEPRHCHRGVVLVLRIGMKPLTTLVYHSWIRLNWIDRRWYDDKPCQLIVMLNDIQ